MRHLLRQIILYLLFVTCLSLLIIAFSDKNKLKQLEILEPIKKSNNL